MNAAGAIGAITVPSARRTETAIGLRWRTRAARAGSVISAAGSVIDRASSLPVISTRLWSVPPERMSPGRGIPVGCWMLTRQVDVREPLVPALLRRLGRERHGEVGRQRLEAAHLDDLHPGLGGALVELVDHLAHERDLAREVGVVGAVFDARLDHGPPVLRVGPDHVEHDLGARGHVGERLRVVEVGRDRLLGAHAPRPRMRSSFAASRAAAPHVVSTSGARSAR